LRNRKLTLWLPALASMIFIVHPLHTEVVANIKSRDDIMVLLGSLLTLWLTINYLDTRKWWYMALATFVFFCALMSKENAVTFLAVIPLTVHFFTNHSLKRNLVSVVPLLGATVVFTIIRYKVLGTIIGDVLPELMNDPFLQATKAQKYATIFYTLGLYVKLLVYPNSLTFDYYPYHIPLINAGDWRMALSLIFYVAIGIVALLQFRKKTIVSYSIWFYLFTLSIVSNLFVPIGAFMGERFIYMSSLAFCLVVAYGIIYLFAHVLKLKTPVFAAAVALGFLLIALPFGYMTIDRNKVWESDYTLFTTDVQTSQNSAYGNLVAGKQFYFKAKEIKDSTERKKYFDLAITHLTKATVIHPRYVNALFFLSEAHYAYNENYQKSLEYLLRLEKLSPDNVDVQYRLGAIYAKYTNDWDNAIKHLKRSLELKPDNFTAMSNLAAVYANSQRYAESIQWFEKMNQLQPNNKEVLSNLRSIYMLLNDQAKVAEYDLKLQQLNK